MENNEKKEWAPKSWHFFVTLMAIGLVVGVIAYFISMSKLIKKSEIYRDSIVIASNDGRLVEAIGSPMRDGTFVAGDLKEENDSGSANIVISLTGPVGSADLFLIAYKKDGKWEYKKLAVKITKSGEEFNLLKQ